MVARGEQAGPGRDKRKGRVPFNYYRSGPVETTNSPFVKRAPKTRKLRKYVVRSLDLVIIIILLGGLIYSLLVSSTPIVTVNDTTYHTQAQYKAAAAKQLSTLKNRNKISLDEQGIVTALEKQFPEIAAVNIELPILSETPVINLSIAEPSFFLSSGGVNYIIDSSGVATSTTKTQPSVKNLVTLSDQSGFHAQVGQQVLSAGSVAFIKTVLQQTAHARVPVKSLVLPTEADELDLYTSDHSYYTKFYMGGNALLETGQFLAARQNFAQTGKQPAQYLDVRVPGKIFYK